MTISQCPGEGKLCCTRGSDAILNSVQWGSELSFSCHKGV